MSGVSGWGLCGILAARHRTTCSVNCLYCGLPVLWIAGCLHCGLSVLQTADCGLQTEDYGLRAAGCGLWTTYTADCLYCVLIVPARLGLVWLAIMQERVSRCIDKLHTWGSADCLPESTQRRLLEGREGLQCFRTAGADTL